MNDLFDYCNLLSASGKTSPECLTPKTTPSGAFWQDLPGKTRHLSRQGENGRTLVVCMVPKEQSRGGFSMPNTSEWPNDAAVCLLSQVLETVSIPPKFFLSSRACEGILRRAEKRGKTLPAVLEQALRQAALVNTNTESEHSGVRGGDLGGGSETLAVTTFPLDSQNWGEGHNSGGKGFGESVDPSFTITKGHSHAVATVVAIQDGRGLDKAQNGKGFNEDDVAYTVDTHATQAVAIQGTVIGRQDHNGPQGSGFDETGACFTLTKTDNHAVAYGMTTAMTPKFAEELSPTLMLPSETGGGQCTAVVTPQYGEIAGSLTARHDSSPCADRGQTVVAFAQNTRDEVREMPIVGALAAQPGMKQTSYIRQDFAVRRLTPAECARLQGFPDDHCKIIFRGKPAADGPQYKAYGNSMAVPCMRWIGERIENYLFEV